MEDAGRESRRRGHSQDCSIERHAGCSVEDCCSSKVQQHADEGVVQDADVEEHLPHCETHTSFSSSDLAPCDL
jgi:hypothetical protein